MMTDLIEMLESNGYVRHESRTYRLLKMTDVLYQKKVKDRHGIRYFINAWYYPPSDNLPQEGVQFEVQFKREESNYYVDVGVSSYSSSVAEAEFNVLWEMMGYDYYKLWSED